MTVDPTRSSIVVRTVDAAFEKYYRQHYGDIVRTLSFTLGDTELGRDAADEAMARTYANWQTVRDYANPAGWTYRVGLNWARSAHRRLARQLPLIGRSEVNAPEVSDPLIAEALRSLDFDLRAVVVCRLLADWSVEQTAIALDIRPGTVKSRLHRALALLETKLHQTQDLS